MPFFLVAGLADASMTRRTGDKGIHGIARHAQGIIVVQCKRNAQENKVGGPAIREFKGAMADYSAWRGYFVTTSGFTRERHRVRRKDALSIATKR
jgi:restriction system protein